jgi:hypothetical protein
LKRGRTLLLCTSPEHLAALLSSLQAQLAELTAAQQQDDDEADPIADQLLELQEKLNASQLELDQAETSLAQATQKEQQ